MQRSCDLIPKLESLPNLPQTTIPVDSSRGGCPAVVSPSSSTTIPSFLLSYILDFSPNPLAHQNFRAVIPHKNSKDYDGFDDDDVDYNDDWSDEEDDMPPDFSDDDAIVDLELSKPEKQVIGSNTSNVKVLDPVLPDGPPRER